MFSVAATLSSRCERYHALRDCRLGRQRARLADVVEAGAAIVAVAPRRDLEKDPF